MIEAKKAESKITETTFIVIFGSKLWCANKEYEGEMLKVITVNNPTQKPKQSIQLINLPKKVDLFSTHVLKGLNSLLCTTIDVTP
jgi:hypothetical protein